MTIDHDHQITDKRRQAKSDGGGRPSRSTGGVVVLLHLAPSSVRPPGQRSMDWEFHPACSLPAMLHRRDTWVPRLRLLVGLPVLSTRLRRWRGLRASAAEPDRQGW